MPGLVALDVSWLSAFSERHADAIFAHALPPLLEYINLSGWTDFLQDSRTWFGCSHAALAEHPVSMVT
jgi:hypothetical protein